MGLQDPHGGSPNFILCWHLPFSLSHIQCSQFPGRIMWVWNFVLPLVTWKLLLTLKNDWCIIPSHANQLTILLWPFSLALSLQLPHSVHIFTCLLVSFTDPAAISIQGLYFPTFVSTRSCIGHAPLTASICVNAFQWTQVHLPSDSILCYPWKTEARLIWKDLGSCLCWVQAWVPLCIWIKVKWGRVAFLSPYFKARANSGCSSSEDQLPGPRSDARSPIFVFWSKHLS